MKYCSVDKIQNTEKMKTQESKEKGNSGKKIRGIGWFVLMFI